MHQGCICFSAYVSLHTYRNLDDLGYLFRPSLAVRARFGDLHLLRHAREQILETQSDLILDRGSFLRTGRGSAASTATAHATHATRHAAHATEHASKAAGESTASAAADADA